MDEKTLRNIKMIEEAMDGIFGGFDWEKTPQGPQYWGEVVENLYQLLK